MTVVYTSAAKSIRPKLLSGSAVIFMVMPCHILAPGAAVNGLADVVVVYYPQQAHISVIATLKVALVKTHTEVTPVTPCPSDGFVDLIGIRSLTSV